MGDSYVEVMVKKKTGAGPMIGRNILIGFGVLTVLFGMLTNIFILFVLLAGLMFLFAWLFHRKICIEYEYLYLDKTLQVDRISNQSSRKKLAEYSLSNMELFAPANSHRLDSYANQAPRCVDFTSHDEDSNPYALMIRNGSLLTKVLIECTDELYDHIRMAGPSKVFKD